jgi:nicotinamide mononucleotide adenylyltransferase
MEDSIGRASALMSRIKWMATAVASVAVVFIVFLIPRIHATLGSADAARPVSNQTTLVERKSFSQVLRLSGTTQAARSFIVSAPQLEGAQLNNLNITSIISPGAPVKTGDVWCSSIPRRRSRDFLEKQKAYTDLVSQAEQKKSDTEIAKAKDDTAPATAENALKRAELEAQRNEIGSRIDAERNQEALEESTSPRAVMVALF